MNTHGPTSVTSCPLCWDLQMIFFHKEAVVLKQLKFFYNEQDSNMGHLWVRRSVVEELEMRVLKAEALLSQKEEDHVMFQHRFEQYEAKMKSMEEMWQKQLMSLQVISLTHYHHIWRCHYQLSFWSVSYLSEFISLSFCFYKVKY